LVGLRVLDTTVTPHAVLPSTLLADLGADVIVLEAPHGHAARRLGPIHGDVSLLWKVTGRNKRSVRCSPTVSSRPWLLELLDRADVLIVDSDVCAFGDVRIELDELRRVAPRLVILSMTGSGRVAEALGGQTFAAGDPARSPLHSGFPIGAATSALFGALGVIAAILERESNERGDGQLVTVAGFHAVLRLMEFLPIFYQQTGFRNERAGNGSSYQVPVATWLTADDEWVTFTGNTNDIVHRLYRAMGRPDLVDDPRFATNEARVANRAVVERTFAEWARSMSRRDLENVCSERNLRGGASFGVGIRMWSTDAYGVSSSSGSPSGKRANLTSRAAATTFIQSIDAGTDVPKAGVVDRLVRQRCPPL
jgi:crotonobetainyl-CoA:carnitine CoA-transferase CaiB-like acyl-CoA transferase